MSPNTGNTDGNKITRATVHDGGPQHVQRKENTIMQTAKEECLSCKWYGIDCTDCEPMREASDKCPRYEPQEEEPYPVRPEDCQ